MYTKNYYEMITEINFLLIMLKIQI